MGRAEAAVHAVPADRAMSPATLRKIVLDIRHQRALLTEREKWAQAQPPSDTRAELFREVNFWRRCLDENEAALARQ